MELSRRKVLAGLVGSAISPIYTNSSVMNPPPTMKLVVEESYVIRQLTVKWTNILKSLPTVPSVNIIKGQGHE
jgi:hypothetical protein